MQVQEFRFIFKTVGVYLREATARCRKIFRRRRRFQRTSRFIERASIVPIAKIK
jgi:hypothetical protein